MICFLVCFFLRTQNITKNNLRKCFFFSALRAWQTNLSFYKDSFPEMYCNVPQVPDRCSGSIVSEYDLQFSNDTFQYWFERILRTVCERVFYSRYYLRSHHIDRQATFVRIDIYVIQMLDHTKNTCWKKIKWFCECLIWYSEIICGTYL